MSPLATSRGSRLRGRAVVVARALAARRPRRKAPGAARRILIAHHLLLGDTLMLTPLIAKLRASHPDADIAMTVPRAFEALYAARPYGVRALPWDPRALPQQLFAEAPFDIAFVPGDNRYAWLAAAMRAGWIVAFGGAASLRKDWPIDALVPYRSTPAAWGDLVTDLVPGPPPPPYAPQDWPAPPCTAFDVPPVPYAVLHVGASTPLKLWASARWVELAATLTAQGITPVFSGGRGEEAMVRECDPQGRYASYAGRLDLAQLWHLCAGARVLVAPDTGVAHLGRIVGVPTVALFGPGSALICGAGDFWRNAQYRALTVDPFPCRDQRVLFGRELDWVRRCGRSPAQCPHPRCMDALGAGTVIAAVADLLR